MRITNVMSLKYRAFSSSTSSGVFGRCSILSVVNVVFDRGIYLADLDLWLDGRVRRQEGYISHAHADHVARHSRALLTPETEMLLRSLLKGTSPHALPYGEPLGTSHFTLTLFPAGHCLGSAQVLLESKATGERTLYTGDIKLKPNPTARPVQAVKCDTLIMESTFGQPQYVFPRQEEVLERCYSILRAWLSAGRTPIVYGYRIGKSQEILYHLLGANFDVTVERSIWEVTETYREAGVSFPAEYHLLANSPKEGQVVISPPGKRRSPELRFNGSRTMALTGWAANPDSRSWFGADELLPFSDHADFNDLLSYVAEIEPKRVFTVNGYPDLAAHLRKLGYDATHLQGRANGQQLRLFQ